MAKLAKFLSSASGSPSGLDVDEVFSTFLYTGNDTTRNITNGIDLNGEGGLVWFKSRTTTTFPGLFDTERGATLRLRSDSPNAEDTLASDLTAFNSNGFTLGNGGTTNTSPRDYASWTFRKAPKFFDVLTYTGTGVARTISHNLGVKPGFYLVKQTSGLGGGWYGYHSGLDSTYTNPSGIRLESTSAAFEANSSLWNLTFPTNTGFTVGTSTGVNALGESYVAYLFAHNDGDGEFGPDADQDIIKCGTYTGAGTSGPTVNLGFEPQWLLIKAAGSTGDWYIFDTMRALTPSSEGYTDRALYANLANGEEARNYVNINQTGFRIVSSVISSGGTPYVYMAIRNGPLKEPTSASDVFAIDTFGGTGGGVAPAFRSTFPVDMALRKTITGTNENWELVQRQIQGTSLRPNDTNILDQGIGAALFDYMNGWNTQTTVNSNAYSWMWKRAPGYFDALYYSGDNNNGRDITHNLGVVPEMIWVKAVDSADNWMVGTQSEGDAYAKLNDYDGFTSDTTRLRMTGNTATTFQVGNDGSVNSSLYNYVAYLFASNAGISKVGSYTGDGIYPRTIDCGFSNGAKFIMIKNATRVIGAKSWYVWDTERGIGAGNDPHLVLNTSAAQETSFDDIDPHSSGFTIAQGGTQSNNNGDTFIFYAIAAP